MSEAPRIQLGSELRRIREAAGLTGTSVAKQLGWSQSKVSRVETGRFGASLGEVADLLNFYGVAEELRAELLARVARAEGLEGSWVVRSGGSPRRQSNVQAIEARVRRIRQYQTLWIPGLLQSPDYAGAVARAGQYGPVAAFTRRRLERQAMVSEARGLRYEAVLEESALRRAPGGNHDALAAQLEHLVSTMDAGWVDLRIRTTEMVSAFAMSSFVLYDFREGPPVVLYEAQSADLYLSTADDIETHDKLFRNLHREALDRDASRALVESMRRNTASQRT